MSRPRNYCNYHALPDGDGHSWGFSLFMEDRGELVRVPEAQHLLFRTVTEARDFAEALERPEPEAKS